MPDNSFDLGLKAKVIDTLRTLSPKIQKKYLNSAVRKGATIVRKAAQANAAKFDNTATPNNISKEIVVRVNAKLGKQNQGVALQVGVKGGARKYQNTKGNRAAGRVGAAYEGPGKVYYWRFLELGTSKMPARNFMRNALNNNAEPATDAIVAAINDGIGAIVGGR